MKKLICLILIVSVFLCGCITRVYQVDGQPINDNFLTAQTLSLDLKLKYNVVNTFNIKEDDETYETYEFLKLTSPETQRVKETNGLNSQIYIFNPNKDYYKIKVHIGTEVNNSSPKRLLYEGNLSRNIIYVKLPTTSTQTIRYHFEVLDKDDALVFRSFDLLYKVDW